MCTETDFTPPPPPPPNTERMCRRSSSAKGKYKISVFVFSGLASTTIHSMTCWLLGAGTPQDMLAEETELTPFCGLVFHSSGQGVFNQ